MKSTFSAKCLQLAPLLFIGFFAPSIQVNAQCTGNNTVQEPTQFQWTYHPVSPNNPAAYYSGELEVGQATFTMNNGQTLSTRAYRQKGGSYSIPGPTIKVVPGTKYVLRFHNTLPYEPLSTSENVFKDANASNIHTHGLHISGTSPGDDVTRVFEGGTGGDFVWDIPADHMGGTYWYHAHHHGSSFLQVSGGLFGMMIVDDSNDGIPAPVAAMEEKQLVLGYLDRGAAGTGGDVLLSGSLSSTWTVNGKIGGNICMPSNTWQHWRILLADRDATMKTVTFGPECEVMLLARDGVWRTVAPKNLDMKMIDLTGASRADIAIRLNGSTSSIKIGNTVVASINASGIANTAPHPFNTNGVSTWSAIRPSYLRDLRNETNVHSESISMGARTINGSKYNHHNANITLPANQVQQWSISGAAMHPFHLHIYHMQALVSTMGFEAGEYYDVISAKMPVRFDLNASSTTAYSGRTIMHCHVLSHEDQGAMGWLNVTGGLGAPTFPTDGNLPTPYSVYYSLSGGGPLPPAAPSNLVATAASSSSINLTWTDNSSDETGFHIERSSDGANFSMLTEAGANVVSFTDNGLPASTTYFYRLTAFNGLNHSNHSMPSNIANATTLATGGGGVAMHVQNITVIRVSANGGRVRGVANVYIVDANGAPVSGATVTGDFSGPTSGTASGTTNSSGQVTLNAASVKNPSGNWCFMVSNVSKTGATYNAAANVLTMACEGGGTMVMNRKSLAAENIGSPTEDLVNEIKIYPNPFRHSTNILFEIEKSSMVHMEVYNVLGQRIALIVHQNYKAGKHQVEFNARNLIPGTYFLRFTANGFTENRMIVLTN